jgi:hypothetical protein
MMREARGREIKTLCGGRNANFDDRPRLKLEDLARSAKLVFHTTQAGHTHTQPRAARGKHD